jgi:hypothetical protein
MARINSIRSPTIFRYYLPLFTFSYIVQRMYCRLVGKINDMVLREIRVLGP